jgi:hypothetical protein
MTTSPEMPLERVRQVHLAGHTDGEIKIDTHDQPVSERRPGTCTHRALPLLGDVAVMIERDDNIPIAGRCWKNLTSHAASMSAAESAGGQPDEPRDTCRQPAGLHGAAARRYAPRNCRRAGGPNRVDIYRNAYRARLVDALRETFPRTARWVGDAPSAGRGTPRDQLTARSWTLDAVGEGFEQTLAIAVCRTIRK